MAQEPIFEGTLAWAGQPAGQAFDYEHYNRANAQKLQSLHEKAHSHCFMSNSVNFPVKVEPDLG